MTAGRICCECQQAIFGEYDEIVRHSASGVRPNDFAHPVGQCPVPEKKLTAKPRRRP
ncbi:hypothetical protein ACWGDE_01885 [Streptomyces sp. NPDC054956]